MIKTTKTSKNNKGISVTKFRTDLTRKLNAINKAFNQQQAELRTLLNQTKEESLDMLAKIKPARTRDTSVTPVKNVKVKPIQEAAPRKTKAKRKISTKKKNDVINRHIDVKNPNLNTQNSGIDEKIAAMKGLSVTEKIVLTEIKRADHPVSTAELHEVIGNRFPTVKTKSKSEDAYKQLIRNTAYQLYMTGKLIKKKLDGKSYLYELKKPGRPTLEKV